MKHLTQAIQYLVENVGGTWGVVIKDLMTNEKWFLNEHNTFYSASIVKLPIMATVFKHVEEGRLSLTDEITLQKTDIVGGAGVLQHMSLGRKYSVEDIVTLMIIQSDNTATNILIDLVGKTPIQEVLKELQMNDSTFSHKLMKDPSDREGSNLTSASDTANLLELLFNGVLVSQQASHLMIQILKKQQIRNCLPHYLPYQENEATDDKPIWKLAHKTGWVPNYRHDAGIFYVNNYPLLASVFSKDVNDIISEKTIAKIGQLIYKYLSQYSFD